MTNNSMTNVSVSKYKYALNYSEETKIFGFWIYLMSNCILFCCFFATYAVLADGKPKDMIGKNIFELPLVMIETILLLLSSVTYGIATTFAKINDKSKVLFWLILTLMFGISFIGMEIYEFFHMLMKDLRPNSNGFLSAFFTLVGTHSLHVISGIIWMIVLSIHIANRGLTIINHTRIICLSLFWHFLDIIWICIFSIVYLIGAI